MYKIQQGSKVFVSQGWVDINIKVTPRLWVAWYLTVWLNYSAQVPLILPHMVCDTDWARLSRISVSIASGGSFIGICCIYTQIRRPVYLVYIFYPSMISHRFSTNCFDPYHSLLHDISVTFPSCSSDEPRIFYTDAIL